MVPWRLAAQNRGGRVYQVYGHLGRARDTCDRLDWDVRDVVCPVDDPHGIEVVGRVSSSVEELGV